MYLLVDNTTNIVQLAGESMPTTIPPSQVLATVDDTDPNVQGATVRPTDYTFMGGVLTRRPYFTLAYDGKTITATLMDAPATLPTEVTFTVAGQAITATPSSSTVTNADGTISNVVTATASVAIHPSLWQYQIQATVSATGFVDNSINLGNSQNVAPVTPMTYTAGTTYTVAPSNATDKDKFAARTFVEAFYGLGVASLPTLLADLMTGISVLVDYSFNVQAAPAGLTADQQSAVKAIQGLTLFTTLANAAPSGGTQQLQFSRFLSDFNKSVKATQDYMADVQTFGW